MTKYYTLSASEIDTHMVFNTCKKHNNNIYDHTCCPNRLS